MHDPIKKPIWREANDPYYKETDSEEKSLAMLKAENDRLDALKRKIKNNSDVNPHDMNNSIIDTVLRKIANQDHRLRMGQTLDDSTVYLNNVAKYGNPEAARVLGERIFKREKGAEKPVKTSLTKRVLGKLSLHR